MAAASKKHRHPKAAGLKRPASAVALTLGGSLRAQTAGVYKTHKAEITDVAPLTVALTDRHNSARIEWNLADDLRVGPTKAENLQMRLAIDAISRRRPCFGMGQKAALNIAPYVIMLDQAPLAFARIEPGDISRGWGKRSDHSSIVEWRFSNWKAFFYRKPDHAV